MGRELVGFCCEFATEATQKTALLQDLLQLVNRGVMRFGLGP